MEVKRSSWHYRLYKKYSCGSEPRSLCSYFWTTILCLFVYVLDGIMSFITRYTGWIILMLFALHVGPKVYVAYTTGKLYADMQHLGWIFAYIIGIFACIIVGIVGISALCHLAPKGFGWIKERETWKLCYGYYRAVKDKVCPLITVVD